VRLPTEHLAAKSYRKVHAAPVHLLYGGRQIQREIVALEQVTFHAMLHGSLGGSYALEQLTDTLERQAEAYLGTIDGMGGMLAVIESGYVQREIQEAAYQAQLALEAGEAITVGVNAFIEEGQEAPIELQRIDPAIEATQRERLAALRAVRDADRVAGLRARLAAAAAGDDDLMPLFIDCVEQDVTLGETCATLRDVWGEYRPEGLL
jgi:methylmalonyl-CoA mutase, N-terminal domain